MTSVGDHSRYHGTAGRKRDRSHRRPRRGYALLTVLIFVLLFLMLLGVGWRRLSTTLRIASFRSAVAQRDVGRLQALARAVHLLETGVPAASPYVCATVVDSSAGPLSYTVTFTLESTNVWSIHVAPTPVSENPPTMPDDFASP